MWEAILMSGDGGDNDPSKGGFKTYDDAYEYIKSMRCNICLKEIEEIGEEEALIPCDAEWEIFKEEEKVIAEAERKFK